MARISPESFWSGPITRTGRSALVPRGPWVYAFTGLGVSYRANPAALGDVVPRPLRVSDGDVFAYIVEIVALSSDAADFAVEAPDQLYYHEGAFFVKVELEGRSYAYCPFMWVDSDISLLRGLLVGWPKKLASIALTKLHPMLPGLDRPRAGLRLGGYVARAGSTLYRMRVKLEGGEEVSALPMITEYPFVLLRYFAGVSQTTATVNELVEFSDEAHVRAWGGSGEIEIHGSINDELHYFKPASDVRGFYFQMLLKPRSVRVVGRAEGFPL